MTEDHPFNNRTMYGATKIAGEQFFRAFHEQHGLDYVGLRYMNVYGPRMDYKGTYVSVIMKVLDRIDAGEPPVDLRRRLAGLRLRPRRRRRAREHPRAEERRHRRRSSTSAPASRRRSTSSSACCWRSPARGSSPSTGRRSRCSSRNRVGSTEKAERAARLPRRDRRCDDGPARRSSSGGAQRPAALAGAPARCRATQPLQIPITKPFFGPEELRGGPAAARERLGRPGPVRRGVRASASPTTPAPPHAVATTSCTTALHLAVAALGAQARATR